MIFIAALIACSLKTHFCVSVVDNDHQFKSAKECEPLRKKVEGNTAKLLKQVDMPGPFQTIVVCRDKAEIDKVVTWLGTQNTKSPKDDGESVKPRGEAPDGSY